MSNGSIELSIIIPTYNERDNIYELFTRIKKTLHNYTEFEIVIVDDNSPDGTAEYARKVGKELSLNTKIVKRPRKMGLLSAVIDGLKIASGKYVAVMDADLQHPPELLLEFLTALRNGAELVIASRYVKGGGVKEWSFIRRIISKGAIILAHVLLPKVREIKDPVSGFFAFRKSCIDPKIFSETHPPGFKILLYIMHKGNFNNVKEIPYIFEPRVRGKSKLSSKEIIDYLKLLLKLSEFRAIKFAIVGALGTAVNLGALAILMYLLGLPNYIAHPIAIEISIIHNFTLNELWTFRRRGISTIIAKMMKFHGSSAIAVITQFVIAQVLSRVLFINYLIAAFIGIVIGYIINYVVSELVVWR